MHQHVLHQLVAQATRQRVRPLANGADHARLAHDRRGAGDALGLVGAQRGGQVGCAAQMPRQHDGVFERLACALAQVRRHGVGGVAQQRDAPIAPALQRRQVVDIVVQDRRLVGCRDQRLDRRVPAAKQIEQVLPVAARWSRCALAGVVLGGKPVGPPTAVAGPCRSVPRAPSTRRGSACHARKARSRATPYSRSSAAVISPKRAPRTAERRPSAPIRMSPWTMRPSASASVTPPASCVTRAAAAPRWSASAGSASSRICIRSARWMTMLISPSRRSISRGETARSASRRASCGWRRWPRGC